MVPALPVLQGRRLMLSRLTIRWDDLIGCYRVNEPNWPGGVVVPAEYHDAVVEQLREDYRVLLTVHHKVQYEALQEYLCSSEDGKRTIDVARRWVTENE